MTDSRRPATRDRPDTTANPHENPYTRSSFRSRPQSEGVRWQHRPAAEDEGARSILTSFWAEYVVQETRAGGCWRQPAQTGTGKAGNPRTGSHRTRTKTRPQQERPRRRACMS